MKNERQDAILEIIREASIETQEDLQARLKKRGIACTQATISRDIRRLHLVKEPDSKGIKRYVVAGDFVRLTKTDKLTRIFRESVDSIAVAQNIVVIKTMPGTAAAACAALDHMGLPEMVGSIAGDDTAFLAMRDAESAAALCEKLREML